MCTLLLAWKMWDDPWLLAAVNRDERLDRPAAPPRFWPERKIVAPKDLQAGGTWWGVNSKGLFVALTNRFGNRPPRQERKSRGLLLLEALERDSAERAADWVAGLAPESYNRFHLVLADGKNAFLFVHDEEKIGRRELSRGWQVITERSFGAGEPEREAWLRDESACWKAPPSDDELQRLLSIHRDDPFAGTCVHAPWLGYGTRSSSILRLGKTNLLSHSEEPPCKKKYLDCSTLLSEVERLHECSSETTPAPPTG